MDTQVLMLIQYLRELNILTKVQEEEIMRRIEDYLIDAQSSHSNIDYEF